QVRGGRSARSTGTAPPSTRATGSGIPAGPGGRATSGPAGTRNNAKAGKSIRGTGGTAASENDTDTKEP
ncbi:MAG TPA: hypothetical protein VEH29_06350, partial [Acidimicrobiales bacterium]|nr:hypothetical protein [Acidimicrobiales bacterium]